MLKAPVGYRYLGRGTQGRGEIWTEYLSDSKQCACGAMYIDVDAGRFGSCDGDQTVLVYQKNSPQ
ncbi:MAG: hypothetical protein NTX57_17950 [Armatimonadetes bacterium]|jgi:hypothetical protein|nr:hypothetical protein [Armatimonadota bacterium]